MTENEIKGTISIQMPRKKTYLDENYFYGSEVVPFQDEINRLLQNVDMQGVLNAEPQFAYDDFIDDMDFHSISTDEVDNKDAMFYLNLSSSGESANISLKNDGNLIDASNYKTMEVSKTLGDILLKSAENNKSLRLDFDNEVTVVLRIAKDGKLDASFIPNNLEVENYLKNNIDYLKVRFDEQSIAYSNISYKPYKEREQKQNQKQGDKNE